MCFATIQVSVDSPQNAFAPRGHQQTASSIGRCVNLARSVRPPTANRYFQAAVGVIPRGERSAITRHQPLGNREPQS